MRQQVLVPLLQMKSRLRANRDAFEVVRARMEDGIPATSPEAASAMLQVVGAAIGGMAISHAAGLTAAVGAGLGLSAGAAPRVTLVILAIAACLIWWPLSNMLASIRSFMRSLDAGFRRAAEA